MMEEGFHAHDGWYFTRLDDGHVKISAAVTRSTEVIRLDPETWASIVASVSEGGDTAERFQWVRRFHRGEMPS